MKKLIIKNINSFIYTLDDGVRNYNVKMEFFDAEPLIGDTLYVHDNLLKSFNELLSFGLIDGIYGRNIQDSNDPDILVLNQGTKRIYLKRYYG